MLSLFCLPLFFACPCTARAQGPSAGEVYAAMVALSLTQAAPLDRTAAVDENGAAEQADGAGRTAGAEIGPAAELVRRTAVTVRIGQVSGSGSILSMDEERVLVVTAAHVAEGAAEGTVRFSAGGMAWEAPCTVLEADGARDIALLSVADADIPAQLRLGLRAVTMSGEETEAAGVGALTSAASEERTAGPRTGDAVFCFRGDEVHAGVVLASEEAEGEEAAGGAGTFFYCLMDAEPGMSGGGVFDARGFYVGLIAGGNDEVTQVIKTRAINMKYHALLLTRP